FKIDNKRDAETDDENNEKTDNKKTAHKKRDDDYNDKDVEKYNHQKPITYQEFDEMKYGEIFHASYHGSENKVEKTEYRTYSDNVGNFEYDDDTDKDTSNNKADENDMIIALD
ncbi:7627_t:CDS:2, partial [Dentiscutata heterogama]